MKRKGSGIKRVGDRIFCARCNLEMIAPKHARLTGQVFCPKCANEALVLKRRKKPDGQ